MYLLLLFIAVYIYIPIYLPHIHKPVHYFSRKCSGCWKPLR